MKASSSHTEEGRTFELEVTRPARPQTTPPCQVACPNAGDIRGWIGLVAQHEKLGISKEEALTQAWGKLVERNPFPATLGRICPHPCESGCNRSDKDGPVAINAMERFIGDWAIEQGLRFDTPEVTRQERVAVVGAGPAGLSFAYQMARRGYAVRVFESKDKAGGMLRFGIPDYRMPPKLLDGEIDRILQMGVTIEYGSRIGRAELEDIRRSFDVVFVGIGAQKSLKLGVPGESGPGCWAGTDFLSAINKGETVDLGKNVVVIGGGNTAVDVARTALRLGSQTTICYRRTRIEMPATPHEIDAALEEGVAIEYLVSPTAVQRNEAGDVTGLVLQRMALGEPDESGRRRPLPVEGSRFTIRASTIVAAVAQVPETDGLDLDGSDSDRLTHDDELEPVLLGGDVVSIGIAGNAIVQGRRAAEAIHERLYGITPPADTAATVAGADFVAPSQYPDVPRVVPPTSSVKARVASMTAQMHETLTEEAFFQEASRCFSCGACFGCQTCFMYCNGAGFSLVETPRPGYYFELDLSRCEGCTKCIELCPCGAIQ